MMRRPINLRVDRVVREGTSDPLYFGWVPALQPSDPELVRARLSPLDYGTVEKDMHQCRLIDGVWHDQGKAPGMRDASWHPDLPDYMAEYIEVTRQVMRAIGHCSVVDVFIENHDDGDGRHSLESTAIFSKRDDEHPGMTRGLVDEQTLDTVPNVRHVERAGVNIATLFGISADDDGSCPDAQPQLRIGEDSLDLSCSDQGRIVNLVSSLRDGVWTHDTFVKVMDTDDDVVERMRAVIDPVRRLKTSAAECDILSAFMGDVAESRVEIIEVVEGGEDVTTFSVVPGTLKGKET